MEVRTLFLILVSIIWLPGCGALSHGDETNLNLQLGLIKNTDRQSFRPYVVLVGEGDLIASNQVDWNISAVLADGTTYDVFVPEEVFGKSGRFNNPYYVYKAWRSIPKDSGILLGSIEAPLWVGPEFDMDLKPEARSFKIQFSLQYYSPTEFQVVNRSFDWSFTEHLDIAPKRYLLN